MRAGLVGLRKGCSTSDNTELALQGIHQPSADAASGSRYLAPFMRTRAEALTLCAQTRFFLTMLWKV